MSEIPKNDADSTKKNLISYAFHGTPVITTEKLNGGKNYLNWHSSVEIWFLGQRLSDHLTKKASEIDDKSKDEWEAADYQLVSVLWNSIEPKLMVHFRPYRSCYEVWQKAKNLYANDIQRLYESVRNLSTLQMTDNDLSEYLARAQSTIDGLKLMLVSDDPKKVLEKLDNMFMVFILHGLPREYGAVRDQALTNTTIPTVENLIDRLTRVSLPSDDTNTAPESSAFISNFSDRGHGRGRGRGRGKGRGRGGRSNYQCTYCKEEGHIRDWCYKLHGYPNKTANVAQSSQGSESKSEYETTFSGNEYKEYLQLKAAQHATSSTTIAHTGNSMVCLSHSTPTGWVLDSGASDHVTGNSSLFSEISPPKYPHYITVADGSTVEATGIGQVSPISSLSLSSVLLIPNCPFNLISISRLTRSLNCSITFTSDSFLIQDLSTGQTIGTGTESRGLYYLQPSTSNIGVAAESPELLHRRLGHPSLSKLKKMVSDLPQLESLQCESCQLGKHVRASFSSRINNRAMSPFDVIHSDVWGPSRVPSTLGYKYYVTFIDDFSRCTWIFLMKDRSELFNIFKNYCSEIMTQFGKTIRILRSDNAKEYFSDRFNSFMHSKGIIHQSSCPHTPQQNGVAERKHRHIVDTARTLLLNANVPLKFWGDAVLTANYLINRMPSSVLNDQVPHSLLYPTDPLYVVSPRVFGCTCFVHDLSPGRDKMSARAIKCVFLGYSRVQKGYRCYSPSTHRFYTSADVTFFEDLPFFANSTAPTPDLDQVLPVPYFEYIESTPLSSVSPEVPDTSSSIESPPPFNRYGITYERRDKPHDSAPAPSVNIPAPAPDVPIVIRKGNRSTRNPHPIYNFLSYHRLSPTYCAFVSALSSVSIPKTIQEALSHPGWRQAIIDEMSALDSNGTWELVPLPSGKSIVGCRWLFNVKVGPDGQIDRLKARLVAKGYTQVHGQDYSDTFSPVAKMASVRLFLAMAAMKHWPLFQLDIKNAFLHGDLEEEIYMEQPPGFVAQGECNLVCKLRKSLYGLKQSPRAWFGRFSKVLQQFGMVRCEADHSVFTKCSSSNKYIYLVVYVDDIVITGDDNEGINSLKQHLFQNFQTKDLGPLRYFLGIEVAQSKSGIAISQRKYALDILEETGLTDCKPVDTPMDPNVKLLPNQGEPYSDPGRYRRLVGKLNYLTMTRPDISFPVSVVSQFLNSPCDNHWNAVIRILKYIKGLPGKGLVFTDRGNTNIIGYSDADWAGDASDRRSTSGYCVFIGGNLISWKSKKQTVVARSSTEAEYRAMAHATCELLWLKHLLEELHFCEIGPMELVCDNQSALHLSSNPVFHERTKHIEVDCHFLREKILTGIIKTSFVNSRDQLADIFTKSLRSPRISYICDKMDAYDIYAPP
ncbi:putative mitochondrial protein [Trifolium repens]|nr:putative mitochondrial protein [Trifolium repens]